MKVIKHTTYFMTDVTRELLKVPEQLYAQEVINYTRYNNEILNTAAPGFWFKLDSYGSYVRGTRNPKLDVSLEEGFYAVLAERQKAVDDLATLKHFIINTLNRTVVCENLYRILPAGLHQYIEAYGVSTTSFPYARVWDDEETDSWSQKNQEKIEKINELLTLNMLV